MWRPKLVELSPDPVVSENSITTKIAENQPVAGFARSRFRIVDLRLASDGRDDSNFWTLRVQVACRLRGGGEGRSFPGVACHVNLRPEIKFPVKNAPS